MGPFFLSSFSVLGFFFSSLGHAACTRPRGFGASGSSRESSRHHGASSASSGAGGLVGGPGAPRSSHGPPTPPRKLRRHAMTRLCILLGLALNLPLLGTRSSADGQPCSAKPSEYLLLSLERGPEVPRAWLLPRRGRWMLLPPFAVGAGRTGSQAGLPACGRRPGRLLLASRGGPGHVEAAAAQAAPAGWSTRLSPPGDGLRQPPEPRAPRTH